MSKDTPTPVGHSGALSSGSRLRYDLIPRYALDRLAKRYTDGAIKYSENNWRKGLNDLVYIKDRLNHLIEHVLGFIESGDAKDDNLSAIMWGCAFLMEAEHVNTSGSGSGSPEGERIARYFSEGPRAVLPDIEPGSPGSVTRGSGANPVAEAVRAAAAGPIASSRRVGTGSRRRGAVGKRNRQRKDKG